MLTARMAKLRKAAMILAGLWLLLSVAWMIPPVQRWIIGSVLVPVVIKPAQQQGDQAKYVLGDFYIHCKAGNYKDAHGLLSHDLQKRMSADDLRQEWAKFITKHGAIRNWHPPGGGTINSAHFSVWPKWAKFHHRIVGAKKSSGSATIRLSPEGKTWRIDELTITP